MIRVRLSGIISLDLTHFCLSHLQHSLKACCDDPHPLMPLSQGGLTLCDTPQALDISGVPVTGRVKSVQTCGLAEILHLKA